MTTPDGHPAPYTRHSSYAAGLAPAALKLDHDRHGAAHIYLDDDHVMSIRIQLTPGRYDTPESHAAALERDRQGLLRLAELATQLADEIAEIQEAGQ